ncbi:zinc finger protein 346-like isoform X2 [Lineus longissimus]
MNGMDIPPPPPLSSPGAPSVPIPPAVKSPNMPNSKKRKAPASEPVSCETCKLSLNSDQQLQQHLQGKAHLKQLTKLKNEATPPTPPKPRQPPQQPGTSVPNQDNSAKLDPVSQAIYDNAMGKLPKKRRVDIHCDICDITLTSEVHADSHFKGSKHLRKLKLQEQKALMTQNDGNENGGDGVQASGMGFHCSFCDMSLNSLQQLEAHRTGERHKKNVEKKKLAADKFVAAIPNKTPVMPPKKIECKTCDIFVNSVQQLQLHLNSMNHQEMLKSKGLLPGSAPRDIQQNAMS